MYPGGDSELILQGWLAILNRGGHSSPMIIIRRVKIYATTISLEAAPQRQAAQISSHMATGRLTRHLLDLWMFVFSTNSYNFLPRAG